ncbi:hypothetical protein ACFL5P_00460 [candidate division KSB1 bacterium]
MTDKQHVSIEELIIAMSFTQDAIVEMLEKKGICTREELLETIKELKIAEQERKAQSGN